MLKVDEQWLSDITYQVNCTDTLLKEEGFTRLGFSKEEEKAIQQFTEISTNLGLHTRQDEAGNVIAKWEGSDSKDAPIAIGSHLDTVKHGGGFDGAAGVICALSAIKTLKDSGFTPSIPIEVICFRSEESSRFGVSTIGSKAMAGLLDKEAIKDVKDEDGTSVQKAVEEVGLTWSNFEKAERMKSELKQFIELHIEQGTRIEQAGSSFGIARAIACPVRLSIELSGKAGHTGTTPMDNRRDALCAAAPLISYVSEEASRRSEASDYPVVATVSTLTVEPNVMTVIPDTVQLGIDIRSVDDELKRELAEAIEKKIISLANESRVECRVETLVDDDSVFLDPETLASLKRVGENLGYKGFDMESGAGHDIMNMAHKWPTGLLFIPCKDGVSHHPSEFASQEDMVMGAEIIAHYLKNEA
ncbi:M20 family metallo-hydrolase [Alkalihalobacillus sp. CinArs1]|uniref:M20 family metallo-hydrolase n=1 Tax=Alkalihalobacillus sp. CinArs1 TaxID=2995314 RepID=UPI0022DCEA4B|nr:M20 family metallo-hydrolase [Alkalihalobacillus sp. CinArs1]